jgi:hypothetical protein
MRKHAQQQVPPDRFKSGFYNCETAIASSTIMAESFDHWCSAPQCGQAILPTKAGIIANEDRSISMPVSISLPVTSHGVKILGIGLQSLPWCRSQRRQRDLPATTKFDVSMQIQAHSFVPLRQVARIRMRRVAPHRQMNGRVGP